MRRRLNSWHATLAGIDLLEAWSSNGDEDKRRRNVERHGYDFLDGVLVFAGEYYCRYSPRQGEERWLAIRSVGGLEMAVVFTLRDEREEITRIISVRRAKRRERRQYHAHLRARGFAPD